MNPSNYARFGGKRRRKETLETGKKKVFDFVVGSSDFFSRTNRRINAFPLVRSGERAVAAVFIWTRGKLSPNFDYLLQYLYISIPPRRNFSNAKCRGPRPLTCR